jgi:diaminopimelate decarboxylase
MDLFEAYAQDKLPKDQGYIVSSFFSNNSAYSIYEIVSYSGVKAIHVTDVGLEFQTAGKKLHILIEPASYPNKSIEPYLRSDREQIPKRFNELEVVTAKNQTKVMIAKKPIDSYSSFTILKPTGINFALVFYSLPDIYASLAAFFEKTLNQEAGVPFVDARKGAKKIAEIIEKTLNFKGDFA